MCQAHSVTLPFSTLTGYMHQVVRWIFIHTCRKERGSHRTGKGVGVVRNREGMAAPHSHVQRRFRNVCCSRCFCCASLKTSCRLDDPPRQNSRHCDLAVGTGRCVKKIEGATILYSTPAHTNISNVVLFDESRHPFLHGKAVLPDYVRAGILKVLVVVPDLQSWTVNKTIR